MAQGSAGAALSAAPPDVSQVDRFFELSLLGLLASGFLAVAGSGYLDAPTVVITAAALLMRVLVVAGLIRFSPPPIVVTLVTLAYIAFYPVDYFVISRAFIPAAIHLVFFVAVVKILTARTDRDYLFLKVIAFLELLAACIVSASFNFFVFLLLFLVLGVATFSSSEIRQSRKRGYSPAKIAGAGVTARLVAAVLSVSLAILVITAGLFFFLPRTARAAFQHLVSHPYHLAGFSNHVTLGEIGEIKQENVPVMHVKMDHPEDRGLALKWRGAALSEFNGRAWFNRPAQGEILRPDRGKLLSLDDESPHRDGRYVSYAVYLNDLAQDALFFAGTPQYVRIDSLVVRRPYGNYSAQFSDARTVSYQVFSRLDAPGPASDPALVEPLSAAARQVYLQLPRLDPRIRQLTESIVGGEVSPVVQARRVENYLRRNYGYTLELPKVEPEDPLAFFLFHRKKGHCEYFASSMAVMLRVLRIPSRVITGFQSGVYNPISGSQLIRSSDAHSWVEAWLPDRGWTTFDPTPPDPNAKLSAWTRLSFYADAVDVFWQDWVLNYNLERQLQLASRVGESGRHIGLNWNEGPRWWSGRNWVGPREFLHRYGFVLLGVLALALLGKFLGRDGWQWWTARQRMLKVQRGEGRASDATLLYQRMLRALRRRGIEKPAWLTPCEFARVLQEPELSLLVEDFTSAYNELRFGGNADAARRIFVLLERLETAR